MSSWTKELDDAILLATSSGRYHVILFCLLCAVASIPTAFLAFSQVFTAATPDHWCTPPGGLSAFNLTSQQMRLVTSPGTRDGKPDSCTMFDLDLGEIDALYQYSRVNDAESGDLVSMIQNKSWAVVPCQYGWTFDHTYYDRTLVTDMELVCDRSWWPRTSNTLFWVGSLVGNLVFGWLSDRWGRRRTILLMVFLEVPLSIATCFSADLTQFTSLRVAGGLFFPALYQIPFILSLELMPPSMRTYTGMVIGMMFASGMCLLAFLAYLLRDWFALSLATSVPFVLLYSYYWLVPESPRWLVGRGRIAEAEEVLLKMARANGVSLQPGFLFRLHNEEKQREHPDLVGLPSIQINGHLCACADRTKGPYKLAKTQSFESEIKPIIEIEKTTNMERMLGFEVEEVVNKKSRLKIDTSPSEDAALIMDIDTNNDVKVTNEEQESQNTKYTQTDAHNIKQKPPNIIDKILCRDNIDINVDIELNNRKFDTDSIEGDNEASPLDLLRYPNIRKKFLILTFDWIANAVVYNGLSYNSTNLGVNDYLAFFIGGAVELPSYLIAWKSMDRFGRRWVLCITMFIGGLSCISCLLVPEDRPWVTVGLAMVGRLCVAASFAVFYVFVGELLPTVLRAQAMGAASFLSGLGLLACPYIVHLAVYSRVLPLAIMGSLSLAGALASLFLPETLHQPLPQTTRDGEEFGRDFAVFSCPAKLEE